ncbi:hypothetical protein JL108_12795 [Aeromicrobium sp. YIM 150415]|uniref:hypothetical protein n=1 Tax=Aeromicrobium TaxID=2040 RepID=UPI00163DDC34|nr:MULTISPECIES: hypothetical protein [Aeromicrobium]MBM9464332.1 hypothetical protein [Aeromicrobium sp. YIM 150415]
MSEPCGRGSALASTDPKPDPRIRVQVAERLAVMAVSLGASTVVVFVLSAVLGAW